MAADYQATLPSWVALIDNVDLAEASTPNSHQDEIVAIATELGTIPKGPSTDVKTRLEHGPVIADMTNKSGGTRNAGDAVIQDTATDSAFKDTTTQGDTKRVFVVAETINNNASGHVHCQGEVDIQVTGNTTRGNYLRMSTTAGKAEDSGSTEPIDGVFAIALDDRTGAGLVRCQLLGVTLRTTLTAAEAGEARFDNLIRDGGFLEYTGATPDFWSRTNSGGGSGQSTTEAFFGSKCEKFVVNPSVTGDLKQTVATITAGTKNEWFRGKKFSFRYYVQTISGLVDKSHCKAKIDDGVGSTESGETDLTDGVWTPIEVTHTMSASATKLEVICRLRNSSGGTNTMIVDGACLVGGSTPVDFAYGHLDIEHY